MIRKTIVVMCGVLVMASLANAQSPRFRWQTGQVLVYRTEHNTIASYVMGENKDETKTRVQSIKRWQVMDVDSAGVATLQMSLQALFFETTPLSGEPLVFDSTHLDKSTPALRKQYENYVGQPLVVVRIDGQGKVLEVKEARPGHSAAKFESEPAFKLLLPAEPLKAGLSWERAYQIVLEPPQGTGDEKYPAVQRYVCKDIANNLATVSLTTEMKGTPAAQEDQVPLWQMQPEGEIVFHLQAGRLQKATLKIDKQAKIEGGNTRFQSSYTEQYVGDR
ncbi:MAG TPA: hypothetical protein VE999_09645 [Gemmataceae bacterium]|nr:hypothetical protein [Gemmataceae bacterium]